MQFKVSVLGIFLLIHVFISCDYGKHEANTVNVNPGNNDSLEVPDIATVDSDSIVNKLQGAWKEMEYPFRLAHFKNNKVKFTEEGVVEAPKYEEYQILNKCPFKVNNLKNARSNDLFLVMDNAGTCEIIEVSNDTLTLSGFSINTNRDYKIVYNKMD